MPDMTYVCSVGPHVIETKPCVDRRRRHEEPAVLRARGHVAHRDMCVLQSGFLSRVANNPETTANIVFVLFILP